MYQQEKNASRFQANIQKLSVTYIAGGEMVTYFYVYIKR
jgi:hypothetical protein